MAQNMHNLDMLNTAHGRLCNADKKVPKLVSLNGRDVTEYKTSRLPGFQRTAVLNNP